jgi:hypothetical protein
MLVAVSSPALAYKIDVSDETKLNLDFLLQAQMVVAQNAAPTKVDWGKDFFVRRVRLIFFGDVIKNVSFFIETDMVNWGKGGDWSLSNAFFIQDAFMTFKVVDEFMVDAGMIITPFSRHGYQGAVALNGIDYHSLVVKYPEGSNKIFRDAGIQLRGYIFEKKLQYRLGVFNGAKNQVLEFEADGKTPLKDGTGKDVALRSNPKDYPRFSGHLRYNILGTETDFFSKGIYFPTEPILSIGVSGDFQPDLALYRGTTFTKKTILDPADPTGIKTLEVKDKVDVPGEIGLYGAVSGDIFFDIPFLTDHEVVFNAAFYKYWYGDLSKNTGLGFFTELGYRWTWLEPVFGVDYFRGSLDNNETLIAHLGFNAWIKQHAANVKLDVQLRKDGKADKDPTKSIAMIDADPITSIVLQGQIYF